MDCMQKPVSDLDEALLILKELSHNNGMIKVATGKICNDKYLQQVKYIKIRGKKFTLSSYNHSSNIY